MAITKTGFNLINRIGPAIGAVGNALGKPFSYVGRFAFPAMTTAVVANDVVSGQRSIGSAVGDAAGAAAGYYGTQKAVDFISNKLRGNKPVPQSPKGFSKQIGYYTKKAPGAALRFALPIGGAMIAGDIGSKLFNKVMPWRRSPINNS